MGVIHVMSHVKDDLDGIAGKGAMSDQFHEIVPSVDANCVDGASGRLCGDGFQWQTPLVNHSWLIAPEQSPEASAFAPGWGSKFGMIGLAISPPQAHESG